jgi:hypothetical protein
MSGAVAMGNNKITGLATPTDNADATTKLYVDGILGSATSAATSAAAAAVSASNAATSASNASTSESNAASSANAAAASYDSFDDRYLGSKTSNPSVDNDGNALLTGALYFNSTAGEMRVWSGSAWVAAYLPAASYATLTGVETLTNKTLNAVVLNDGYTEEVFAVTGTAPALSPTNGSIQTWTLSGNSTPTAGTWATGQSLTLMVDDGSAFTITWTSMGVTWKTNTGSAPTLQTTGFTAIQLWKVGSVIYGARVGDA